MKLVNLTPHAIVFINENKGQLVVQPSGQLARVSAHKVLIDYIEAEGLKIPVNRTILGEVEGLPEPQEGVIYIVSLLTAQACPNRKDLYVVDETVRDNQGRIIGCKSLGQI